MANIQMGEVDLKELDEIRDRGVFRTRTETIRALMRLWKRVYRDEFKQSGRGKKG